MVNNSSETVNQPSGKQLIATILNLKSENRLYKCLNKVKDEIVKAKIQYTEEVKKENLSHEATFLANEKIISGQKNVIDDLNKQVESLNKQLATTKSSIDDRSKSVETHQSTIQKLSFNLKEAQKYIDDQNYAIDQLRKRLSDCKNDHENHKKALKERFLERIEKAKEEMEVEREKSTQKLMQTREFYDAEGRDLRRKIDQLKDELDLLRRADFNRPTQSTSRGKGRKRPTSTTRDSAGTKATPNKRKGRPTINKTNRFPEVDSSTIIDDDDLESESRPKAQQKAPVADSLFPDTQSDRSPSPIVWLSQPNYKEESDTE